MPLFIDRLPFRRWTDATRTPPVVHWSVIVPVLLTEPWLPAAPPVAGVEDWVIDTGNRGEAFAWRHHLVQAGLDPNRTRQPPVNIRTVSGQVLAPVRAASLWLVSNLAHLQGSPYRVVLQRGLPFHDVPHLPDPEFQRPLIGLRAMRTAGLRVEIDFANDTVSVWTLDPPGPP